jgi:hypothetical protein
MFLRHRIEWDYSWLADLPGEVSLCCVYEYCRYALLSINSSFVFSKSIPPARAIYLIRLHPNSFGAATYFSSHYPASLRFPQMPYLRARELFAFDPQSALSIIDGSQYDFGHKLELRLPPSATSRQKAIELLAEARNDLPPCERPKRGAGARIRQDKTALKDLGALKLLEVMHVPEAMRHTEGFLGKPLFAHESQWSRARSRARATLGDDPGDCCVPPRLLRCCGGYSFREEARLWLRAMNRR